MSRDCSEEQAQKQEQEPWYQQQASKQHRLPHQRGRRKGLWWKALVAAGAATAAVLAGAGAAMVLLHPRMEELESNCLQVGRLQGVGVGRAFGLLGGCRRGMVLLAAAEQMDVRRN